MCVSGLWCDVQSCARREGKRESVAVVVQRAKSQLSPLPCRDRAWLGISKLGPPDRSRKTRTLIYSPEENIHVLWT